MSHPARIAAAATPRHELHAQLEGQLVPHRNSDATVRAALACLAALLAGVVCHWLVPDGALPGSAIVIRFAPLVVLALAVVTTPRGRIGRDSDQVRR